MKNKVILGKIGLEADQNLYLGGIFDKILLLSFFGAKSVDFD